MSTKDDGGGWWLIGLILFAAGVFDSEDDKAAEVEKVDNKPKVVQTAHKAVEAVMSMPEATDPSPETAEELFRDAFDEGDEDLFKDTFDEALPDQ